MTHPIVLRRLEVAAVQDVTERMRRVTLTGHQLEAFTRDGLDLPALVSTGFDDHVKLVLTDGGDLATALPVQRAHSIDWPDAPHRRMRDYTPRRWDPVAGELDLDFVRHGDGPAARWAEQVRVGDALHIAGPKSSLVLPERVDWVLLAGDETAIPAIGRFLDERPTTAPVQVVVEIRDPRARQDLALRVGDTVRWVLTGPGAPSALSDAVRTTQWWPGEVFAWAAGESRSLLALRRWLTRDRMVPKSHQNVTGYWQEEAGVGHDAATAPVDAHAVLSPLPWFAARAALSLGLLDAVADTPRTSREAAAAVGLAESAVGALLDYLVSVDVCARDGDRIGLGPVGEVLLGDDALRAEVEDGLESRTVVALVELGAAVGGGVPGGVPSDGPGEAGAQPGGASSGTVHDGATAYERRYARTLWTELRDDAALVRDQLARAVGFQFVVGAVPALAAWQGARRVVVSGTGSPTLVDCAGLDAVSFVVAEPPVVADVLLAVVERTDVVAGDLGGVSAEGVGADLAVSALALSYRTDDEARRLLAGMAEAADRLLVIEELAAPDVPTPHAAEHALLHLAVTGSGTRRPADVVRLAEAAGWTLVARTSLGWSYEAFELARVGEAGELTAR